MVQEFKNEMVKKYNRQKDKDYLEKIKQFQHCPKRGWGNKTKT